MSWLVCSTNTVITNITFASYGTPSGTPGQCDTYAVNSACDAAARCGRAWHAVLAVFVDDPPCVDGEASA